MCDGSLKVRDVDAQRIGVLMWHCILLSRPAFQAGQRSRPALALQGLLLRGDQE